MMCSSALVSNSGAGYWYQVAMPSLLRTAYPFPDLDIEGTQSEHPKISPGNNRLSESGSTRVRW
jgi:hypothetical protein